MRFDPNRAPDGASKEAPVETRSVLSVAALALPDPRYHPVPRRHGLYGQGAFAEPAGSVQDFDRGFDRAGKAFARVRAQTVDHVRQGAIDEQEGQSRKHRGEADGGGSGSQLRQQAFSFAFGGEGARGPFTAFDLRVRAQRNEEALRSKRRRQSFSQARSAGSRSNDAGWARRVVRRHELASAHPNQESRPDSGLQEDDARFR